MKIYYLIFRQGQLDCLSPLTSEFKKRGHQVYMPQDLITSPRFINFKKLNLEKYDVVIACDENYTARCCEEDINIKLMVVMAHGVWAKRGYNMFDACFRTKRKVDLVLVPGKNKKTALSNKYKKFLNRMVIAGFPKTDFLIKNQNKKEICKLEFYKRYDFKKNKKLIAFVPTGSHKEKSNGVLGQALLINKYLSKSNYNMIIAPHPSDLKFGVEWIEQLQWKINFPICPDSNKNKLLIASDLILTDNSSMGLEGALIGKPIVHIINDFSENCMHIHRDKKFPKYKLGEVLTFPQDANKLMGAIDAAFTDKYSKFDKEIKHWLDYFCSGCDGNSVKKYVDAIEKKYNEKFNIRN